jgi:hypothetical protein
VIALPTTLFDRQENHDIQAELRFDLTADEIFAVEAAWGPIRSEAVERLVRMGFPSEQMPQHWHWDWRWKVPKLALRGYRGIAVKIASEVQGLMLVATANYVTRLPPDLNGPLVYVDYIESAPWNVQPLSENPRYRGVGKRLIWAAVRVSQDEGFHGRLGLHSLPQSVEFYERTCGMVRLGPDPDYQGLDYFEMTGERALMILAGGAV